MSSQGKPFFWKVFGNRKLGRNTWPAHVAGAGRMWSSAPLRAAGADSQSRANNREKARNRIVIWTFADLAIRSQVLARSSGILQSQGGAFCFAACPGEAKVDPETGDMTWT